MKTPKTMQDLAINAYVYLESKGFKIELPELIWRKSSYHTLSSGHAQGKAKIVVTAGKDRLDQKLVVLHEIAHTVTESKIVYMDTSEKGLLKRFAYTTIKPGSKIISKRYYHTDDFWQIAFDLYRQFRLPMRYCVNREKDYRKNAIKVYRANRSNRE